MKKVFLSQPVDLISAQDIIKKTCFVQNFLNDMGYVIVNSFEKLNNNSNEEQVNELVKTQIDKIKLSDFIVADLSIPNFTYVGCIGEIIYAHLFEKKAYVIVGNTNNDQRLWLKYHVTKFFKTYDELKQFLLNSDMN